MKKICACKLSDIATEAYGQAVSFPMLMEDQKLVEVSVSTTCDQEKEAIKKFMQDGQLPDLVSEGLWGPIEILLNGLCDRDKIEEGEYLLKFDD